MPSGFSPATPSHNLFADVETENFNLGNGVIQKRSRVQTLSLPKDVIMKAVANTDKDYITINFHDDLPMYTNIESVSLPEKDATVLTFTKKIANT